MSLQDFNLGPSLREPFLQTIDGGVFFIAHLALRLPHQLPRQDLFLRSLGNLAPLKSAFFCRLTNVIKTPTRVPGYGIRHQAIAHPKMIDFFKPDYDRSSKMRTGAHAA